MDKYITATEANQRFSELLRDVSGGDSYTVTSRGKPVAKVVPVEKVNKQKATQAFIAELENMPNIKGKPWKREDLYGRSDRNLP